jgi:hypothetical protein
VRGVQASITSIVSIHKLLAKFDRVHRRATHIVRYATIVTIAFAVMNTPPIQIISHPSPASSNPPRGRVHFYSTKTFRLLTMLSLTFSFFVVELVVGNITHSLALVADAFHMLSDVISLIIGLLAVRIAKRRSNMHTYGWAHSEIAKMLIILTINNVGSQRRIFRCELLLRFWKLPPPIGNTLWHEVCRLTRITECHSEVN